MSRKFYHTWMSSEIYEYKDDGTIFRHYNGSTKKIDTMCYPWDNLSNLLGFIKEANSGHLIKEKINNNNLEDFLLTPEDFYL